MTRLNQVLTRAICQLESYTSTARIDAESLLAYVLKKNKTYLYAYPDTLLSKEEYSNFQQLVADRILGMPVAYITGIREFWSLPLWVNRATLIPRPETELLVELALDMLKNQYAAQILDLGTGSGAIALALAKERTDWQIDACDCNQVALQIAKKNAEHLELSTVCFYYSDWFSMINISRQFHAIISNPPYIAANDPHLSDLRFEPQLALLGGSDGLSSLKHIIKHSIARLKPGGLLLVEHGFDQKQPVMSMLNDYGYEQVQCWRDLYGRDRVSGGRKRINS